MKSINTSMACPNSMSKVTTQIEWSQSENLSNGSNFDEEHVMAGVEDEGDDEDLGMFCGGFCGDG